MVDIIIGPSVFRINYFICWNTKWFFWERQALALFCHLKSLKETFIGLPRSLKQHVVKQDMNLFSQDFKKYPIWPNVILFMRFQKKIWMSWCSQPYQLPQLSTCQLLKLNSFQHVWTYLCAAQSKFPVLFFFKDYCLTQYRLYCWVADKEAENLDDMQQDAAQSKLGVVLVIVFGWYLSFNVFIFFYCVFIELPSLWISEQAILSYPNVWKLNLKPHYITCLP